MQTRLQRCAEGCSDTARDNLTASPTDAEMAKAEKLAETCALKCCDDVIVALPRLETRIKENLSKA